MVIVWNKNDWMLIGGMILIMIGLFGMYNEIQRPPYDPQPIDED